MKKEEGESSEDRIEIFKDKSILKVGNANSEVFHEGRPSKEAENRYNQIKKKFNDGYLRNVINECREGKVESIEDKGIDKVLVSLVDSISSQYGRALVGLFVVQLCVKAISPDQSIRLHKGGKGDFSWREGISMRTLDSKFIAPELRKFDLLKYNQFGVMMSRSFAENYPYTKFYKASIRGPKEIWLTLVDLLEKRSLNPEQALKRIISLLIVRSDRFARIVKRTVENTSQLMDKVKEEDRLVGLMLKHIKESQHPARLFEIVMHSLVYTISEVSNVEWYLRPLSQMRSANKKFGNIGDIEILSSEEGSNNIIQAWDAKYGRTYLFDELGELTDKLASHKGLEDVGFVTIDTPELTNEIEERLTEVRETFGIDVKLMTFREWVEYMLKENSLILKDVAGKWLSNYVDYICLREKDIAPIEEPTEVWLDELNNIIEKLLPSI